MNALYIPSLCNLYLDCQIQNDIAYCVIKFDVNANSITDLTVNKKTASLINPILFRNGTGQKN